MSLTVQLRGKGSWGLSLISDLVCMLVRLGNYLLWYMNELDSEICPVKWIYLVLCDIICVWWMDLVTVTV